MGLSNPKARSWKSRALAATATVGAVAYALVAGGTAHATTSNLFTITKVSPNRFAALTANQVITVTGTGFDESLIKSVTIDACTNPPLYIVQSATTLLLKTDNSCAVQANAVVTVTDNSNATVVSNPAATGGAQKLDFVAAPTILTPTASARPVVTENSSGVAYGSQVTSGSTSGGTVVRVYSGATAFVNSTTFPLAASLDGVAMTKVTMHTGGDYFTAVLGAHAADAAPVLKITSNGVSKSFAYGAGGASGVAGTHDFTLAGVTVSVSPASGPINGNNTLTITGTGFTSGTTVKVGGVTCPVTGTTTATKVTCTVAPVTAAGPVSVVTTTGSLVSVTSAGSTYTFLDQ